MLYEVNHVTTFAYSSPVSESVIELRLQPVSDRRQRCLEFELSAGGALRFRFDTDQVQPMRFSAAPALKSNLLSRQPFAQVNEETREVDATGEPVPVWLIEELLKLTGARQTVFSLQAGDILMLDNSRTMHGRKPYTDPGRRVVTLCTWLGPGDGDASAC